MRKTLTVLIILLFALTSSGWLFSQQNEEDQKFQKTIEKYLDALWKFYPTAATSAGYHNYDNKLEDLGKRNIEKRHDELDELNQEFVAKVDKLKLSPDFQIDHEIAVETLEMELIRHEDLVPWGYNPLFYNDIFANCIRSIFESSVGTAEERAKNASDRLKDLPKLIKQARENLETPAQIYTESAIHQFESILDYYQNQLPLQVAEAPASQQSKLQENLTKALPELLGYQAYLQNELLPKSTGNFRLAAVHNRMLRLMLKNDIPIQDMVAQAQADIENIRREMTLICTPFYKIMEPRFDINNPPGNLTPDQLMNEIVTHVMARFKDDHVTREEFMPRIGTLMSEIRSFLQENQLVDLPDADLPIEMMPVRDRGFTTTRLIHPNLYESTNNYTVQIGLLPENADEETAQSVLEEYNNHLLPFYVIREVYPGEFVPFFITNNNTTSLIRKLTPSYPLIKGWPLFVEEMMVLKGYGNYDLRLRLNQLKLRMKAAIDFIVELNIHQGSWTKEQASAYMVRKGFYSELEAGSNWDHILLVPGNATYAYVGLQEYLAMEKIQKEKLGDAYNQKDFLNLVLSYGNIPFRHLKQKISE